MRILIILFMFLIVGGLFIIGNENLQMYKTENIIQFKTLYTNWLFELILNTKNITGNAINLKWLPGNESG